MSLLILSLLVQAAFIVHVIKTGRNQLWIWVLIIPGLALTGLYEHDPNLMLGLAQAQFGKGEASAARATLDELIRHNPDFRSPTGHLLYARALEAEGNVPKALEEYAVLAPSYPGAEASV